ncbi:aldehyde dehydrogenase family protein [Pseudonocardia sp. NPDC049635]|uniref:aldehyde dehydrogenase family protein n=1 Tax=Pseudonocardia sp. NPDC049635 TaxID=3155506 RepID=UPI0033EB830C
MAELETLRNLIGGEYVDAASGATFETQNPYTRAAVGDPSGQRARRRRRRRHGRPHRADGEWGRTTGFARAAMLRRLGELVGETAEKLARQEVNDSGKLYREMIGQLNGLGGWYQYFAGLADKIEGRQIPSPNPNYLVYTRREPVGVVAAITPWNSPLLMMTWKLAPALAAGCTIVVKPSEHAPASTLGFATLIEEAGFPPSARAADSTGDRHTERGQQRSTGPSGQRDRDLLDRGRQP